MEQRIIYTANDGTLMCVSLPASGARSIDEIAQKDVPGATPYRIVDAADLRADRTFRAAWETDCSQPNTAITINMTTARDIGHSLRRAQRQALLAPLDAQINWNVKNAAAVDALEAQRQTIRNANAAMQTAIDAASTPAAITAALAMNDGEQACA